MYKNIELLNKKEHNALFFKSDYQFNDKLVPITLKEFVRYNLPIIISGGKRQEFLLITALPWQESLFFKKDCSILKTPDIYNMYPFTYVNAKNEKDDKLYKAIAIDKDGMSENGEIALFENDDLSKTAKQKINIAKTFFELKEIEQKMIEELKRYELLDKREFDIKIKDETKPILKEFYVINRNRLYNLDERILKEWEKRNWLFLIEYHINSINNIENLFLRDRKN